MPDNRAPAFFSDFSQAAEAVGKTTRRLQKVGILGAYFGGLDDADLAIACRFLSGNPFPVSDERTLNVGFSAVSGVILELSGADPRRYGELVLRLGDPGDAAAELLQNPQGAKPLTLRDAQQAFEAVASTRGAKQKALLLRALLARATPLEGKYLVKLVMGEFRMGLRESLVEEALARLAGITTEQVQWANMLLGDIGETALLARHGRLAEATMRLFHPLKFMLATPVDSPQEIVTEGSGRGEKSVFVEDKYDGVRAQLHKAGDRIELYSRTLDPVTHRFPEVVSALKVLGHEVIFDGEIVAFSESEGRCLPFNALQKRLGRKTVSDKLMSEVPAACMVFDLLYLDGQVLLDAPLTRRKELLDTLDLRYPLVKAPSEAVSLDDFALPAEEERHRLDTLFDAARERGNEGLMVKMPGSPYSPGKRGKSWLKVKKALATLDVVVTAVEWGHGKRAHMLSDYTFAVRDEEGNLYNVGKAYSGLTDAEINEMTSFFQAHTIRDFGRVRLVEPVVVIEVAFDKIQPSPRHKSGYALRFPRIVRLRPDKRPQDSNTLEDVRAIAERM